MLHRIHDREINMQNRRTISLIRLALTFAACVVIAGCASTPDVYSNRDPSANFSKYRTYNFEKELGTDRPGTAATSLVSQYLMSATNREMESRGYKRSDSPDLLINFYIQTQDKIRATQTPTTGGYYGYRGGRYGTWGGYGGYETQVTQYTQGTLTVDVIEVERKQLVWEGTLVGRMSEKVMENLEERASKAIQTVFTDFPHMAGSYGSQVTKDK
jgi:hypothetical protein